DQLDGLGRDSAPLYRELHVLPPEGNVLGGLPSPGRLSSPPKAAPWSRGKVSHPRLSQTSPPNRSGWSIAKVPKKFQSLLSSGTLARAARQRWVKRAAEWVSTNTSKSAHP